MVTIIPFWILKSSFGKPYKFHSPTIDSSTKNYVNSKLGVTGIFLFFKSLKKYSYYNIFLNSALKGPQYETNAHDNEALPTNLYFYNPISESPLLHLSFSSDKDLIS